MNLSGALIYLVSTIIDLYIAAIMLRLLLQWVRADFYNPLCQFLVKITNPVLVPARRIVPSIGRLDTASVVVMLLLELIQLVIISQLSQAGFELQFMLLFAIRKLVVALLMTYFVLVIATVLKPFSKLVPPLGGVDLSPLIALIALRFLLLLLGW